MLVLTGLGSRMGDVVYKLSGGSLLGATLLMVVAGIVMAAGMPAIVTYFVMVTTFQPVFYAFDVPVAAVHFVAFYAGILHQLLLPVGASVIVAATIARASFWKSGIEALKMSIPLVTMPFLIITTPELLLGVGNRELSPLVVAAIVTSTCAISFGMGGWLGVRVTMALRAGLVAIGGIAYAGVFQRSDALLVVGVVASLGAFLAGVARFWLKRRGSIAVEQPVAAIE